MSTHLSKDVHIQGIRMIKIILALKRKSNFFWRMTLVETVLNDGISEPSTEISMPILEIK
jgi:hypothetical protein